MIINKLTASFGKLENASLGFDNGLNVIYAPNESGKSTWCAFIRAMLFGVDSSERKSAGRLPDKLRYAPWSGAPMEGSMELTLHGRGITLTRATKTRSAPMREFKATYTGSSIPVDGLNAANAGETLTGVSRDVFCRSAFIGQGAVAVAGSPELEKRISSIVSAGDEQTSYTEADERLRAWQRKRRYNRRGYLPELEAKMDETQRALSAMDGTLDKIHSLESALEKSGARCSELETAVMESRKRQRREALEKLNNGRAALKAAQNAHDAAQGALNAAKDDMRAAPFGMLSAEETARAAGEDMEKLDALSKKSRLKAAPYLIAALVCLALTALSAVMYAQFENLMLIGFAAVFFIASVVMLTRYMAIKREAEDAKARRQKLLNKYGVHRSSEIRALVDEQSALTAALDEAEMREAETRKAYETARAEQEKLEETALNELDFTSGSSEAARLTRELAAERANAEHISAQIASLNGRLAATGDPLVLASDLKTMEDSYDEISAEYGAISLAVDTLREADTEIQSRFSPKLGRLAAQYMSFMTGGRYSDIMINRDFTALTKTQSDSVARPSEYLSAGTLDLLYLAVRLAVCELAMPEGETCPLVIDDALVNLDAERQKQAMSLLKELAKKRQIILFTCREIPEA